MSPAGKLAFDRSRDGSNTSWTMVRASPYRVSASSAVSADSGVADIASVRRSARGGSCGTLLEEDVQGLYRHETGRWSEGKLKENQHYSPARRHHRAPIKSRSSSAVKTQHSASPKRPTVKHARPTMPVVTAMSTEACLGCRGECTDVNCPTRELEATTMCKSTSYQEALRRVSSSSSSDTPMPMDAPPPAVNVMMRAPKEPNSDFDDEENTSARSSHNLPMMLSSMSTMGSSLERSLEMAAIHSDGLSDKEHRVHMVKTMIANRKQQGDALVGRIVDMICETSTSSEEDAHFYGQAPTSTENTTVT